MRRCVLVVCLAVLSCGTALPASAEEADADSVVLVPSETECDLNAKISVSYQRVSNEREDSERTDFIGLFRKTDPTALAPYDVALIGEIAQTGSVSIRCRKAGEMEVRMIRNPGHIIGTADLTVFAPCAVADCNGHGTCTEGTCVCDAGWEGPVCDLISGSGMSLSWVGHENGEFYFGDSITAKVFHSATEVQGTGVDIVQVVRVDSPNYAATSGYIPVGKSEVEIPLPSNPGKYFLELKRGLDGEVIAASDHFAMYAPCPFSCSLHGSCVAGECVCDSGFDRADCSRGPGVVSLAFSGEAYSGAIMNVNFTRNETIKGVLTDQDWVGIYKETDESCDNPEYFAYAISDKIYDPDVLVHSASNISQGSVQIVLPLEPGNYVLKYVRQDHAKYHVSEPFTVYEPCPNRCQDHGHCEQGVCVCDDGWQGRDCDGGTAAFELTLVEPKAELYVGDIITAHFSRPAGNNTDYDFIGVYASNSANNTDQLYGYVYAIANRTERDLPVLQGDVEIEAPAAGNLTLRYVNAYSLETEVELATVFEVFNECPNNCSGHGPCVRGVCHCDAGKWKGEDCSKGAGIVELTPTDGSPVVIKAGHVGFLVHVTRPVNHYSAGDFVGLFPAAGPYEADQSSAYTYAKFEDEADVFLIVSSLAASRASGSYLVKYFNPAHEELGTSDNFEIVFED